jgi:cytochrome P450
MTDPATAVPHSADDVLGAVLARDPDAVRCPYPAYRMLRDERPVAWSERLNAWVVTRYDDILQVLRDPQTFSSVMASGPSSVTPLARRVADDPSFSPVTRRQAQRRIELSASPVLLLCDPPLHRRQRGLVSAAFTPRRVARMEPDIERISSELVDGFVDDGAVELVSRFAMPLPMTVIATVLGVPAEMMATFKDWSDAFTKGVGALEHTPEALTELFQQVDDFYEYFDARLDERSAAPADDLLSDLLAARLDDEQPLTRDEILNMLVQFLVAGNETTTNLISTIVAVLAASPELTERVRDDRDVLPGLVEECLRMESPVQGMFRHATRDAFIGDQPVRADDAVFVVYGSGNRDAATFADPDTLRLDEPRGQHLAFGRGEHVCLGATIARKEAQIAVGVLLDRLDDWALREPATYHSSFVLHGPARLPLTFVRKA